MNFEGGVSLVITQRCYQRQTKPGLHSNTSEHHGRYWAHDGKGKNLESGEDSQVETEQSERQVIPGYKFCLKLGKYAEGTKVILDLNREPGHISKNQEYELFPKSHVCPLTSLNSKKRVDVVGHRY